ncbi:MAG: class I SAM-dependent methyltransferase [Candidatus Thorarchaeota archaeon]
MISTISAWLEIMKAIGARDIAKVLREYYRALSVNVLRKEGLFDFLVSPRKIQDIADHFGYTDLEYLTKYLEVFANDDIIIKENGTFRTNGSVNEFPLEPPKDFGPGFVQVTTDASAGIPDRMRGHYITFSDEMSTFNWDDSLRMKMYDSIRRAAFKYTDALKRGGNFIDVGCGNGVGTAAIWGYYYKKGSFQSNNPVKIYGLEYDPNLKRIAEEEFSYSAARLLNVDRDVVDALKEHHPTFVHGNAEELPFDDEFFDMVYTSQVIHWCDAEKATKEMMRVLKPDGLMFGTEAFHPTMDSYVEMYILLNEGAYGSIKKEDFFRWVQEAGASDVNSVTPAGVFRVLK